MTDFATELLRHLGEAEDSFDIRVVARRCYHYDFLEYPVRIWDGQGVLTDSGGNEWLGSVTADGTNLHSVPELKDPRDGSSPRYEFSLPFIDQDTFEALKADQDLAKDRELTTYHAIFGQGEGLLPQTPLLFSYRLIIRGVRFSEGLQEIEPGKIQRTYSAAVLCRTLEYGRSRFPGGSYNDVTQNERAALLGLSSDSGCVFVSGNANRTYIFD